MVGAGRRHLLAIAGVLRFVTVKMGRKESIDWRAHELLSDVRAAPASIEGAGAEPAVAEPASTVPAAESDAGLPRLEAVAGEPSPTVTVMAGRPVAPAPAPPPPSPR